jgi:lipoprotein signal peptidase
MAWVRRLPVAAIPLALLALDRLAKWYASATLPMGGGVVLFSGLKYEYFQNTGLAFSLFSPTVALVASVAALCGFTAYAYAETKRRQTLPARKFAAYGLIIVGGISNTYDRIFSGGVVDYILFARSAWNIADLMILAGIALLIFGHEPKGGIQKN